MEITLRTCFLTPLIRNGSIRMMFVYLFFISCEISVLRLLVESSEKQKHIKRNCLSAGQKG